MKIIKIALLSSAVSVSMLAPAMAQDAEGAASTASARSGGLEEIIVTARRTSETMQDVPVAITAIGGAFLERQNVMDATALPRLAPNLTIALQPGSQSAAAVFIRGIGNQEPSALSEQGVGIYLDGVYLARAGGAVFDLLDLERVEVLRGPQGTTFGRNTIGGALQLVSKRPTDDFGVSAKAGFARYNDWFVRSRVDTGELGNSGIALSFAGMHREAGGYVDNALTPSSNDPGSLNSDAFAVAAQGNFGDLTVNYNFDFADRRGANAFFQIIAARPDVAAYFGQSESLGGAPFQLGADRMQDVLQAPYARPGYDRDFTSHSKIWGHSLTVEYDALPGLTLKSITGYRRFFQNAINQLSGNGDLRGPVVTFDGNGTAGLTTGDVFTFNIHNTPQRQRQFSQEFQLLGSSGDFSYLGGVYYFHERASEDNYQQITLVTPISGLSYFGLPDAASQILAANAGLDQNSLVGFNLAPNQAFGGTAESAAVFGQVSWKPTALDEKLEITIGGRYTQDKKTAELAGDIQPAETGFVNFTNVSWLGSMSYRFTDDVMVYGRVSSGYRSGGINPRAGFINQFAPEKAIAYEAGIKSELFDRRLRLNLSAYLTDYDNLQVQQFAADSGGASSLTVNAGKVQLKGFEAEATLTPVAGLVFDGSVGYISTNYKEFLFRDPISSVISDVSDVARPIYTPKWSTRLGGEYSADVGNALARFRVDYSWRSALYFNALDAITPFNVESRSRADENLRMRLSLEDVKMGRSTMSVGLWGDNITNQKNIAYSIDFGSLGFAGAVFKKPATYGADISITF